MINQIVKKKWLEALRSGEYLQGQGFLCRNERYCCLGVLQDLFHKEHGSSKRENANQFHVDKFVPTREVFAWLGLAYSEIEDQLGCDLMQLNDKYCMPFTEIASRLECLV